MKSALFCKLLAGLDSTNKSATSLLLSDSCSVLSFIFPFTSISCRNCPLSPPVLSGYNGYLDTRFSRGMTRLISWPDGEHYSRPLQSLVVSLLIISRIHFSRTGGVLSHRNPSTHRFPQFLPKNLCSLVTLAVFLLVYAIFVPYQ